jgi:peptidoglycan/LPS O-acetylase OafA/YrhL
MTAGLLGSVFLSAVALYFAEPKPSPGARTLIDAVYLRAFLLFGGMLIGVLVCTRLPESARAWLMMAIAALALPAAWLLLLVPLRQAIRRQTNGL